MHRVMIVLRCACSKRSFQSLKDPWYLAEVQLLLPGALLPSPQTSQRDLLLLHEAFIPLFIKYFLVGLTSSLFSVFFRVALILAQTRNREVHLAADGWTSPIHVSNLGLVVEWEDGGVMYRALIEMIRYLFCLRCLVYIY